MVFNLLIVGECRLEMRKREYHHFPKNDVEFQQKYSFWSNLPYLVKTFAGMNDKSGAFQLVTPKGETLKAKRSISVEIAEANIDFRPLTNDNLNYILGDIDDSGLLDFRIGLLYSYLDKDYKRIPYRKDTFLVRSDLTSGILTLLIHPHDGPGLTTCHEIANTIVTELEKGNTN
jgi:hypothetical protein